MVWNSNRNWMARAGVLVLAFVLGASASAGTLYSWKTEDGTFAYTNEKKRIPAKYKTEAKKSTLKSMESYERFTPGPKIDDTAYGDRIVQRLEVFHAADGATVASGAEPHFGAQAYVKLELGDEGGNAIEIPIDSAAGDAEGKAQSPPAPARTPAPISAHTHHGVDSSSGFFFFFFLVFFL